MLKRLLETLGPLRSMLVTGSVLASGGAFFASGGYYDPMSWAIVPRAVEPIMAVSLLFLLPLDMLMTRVFISSTQGEERQRYRRIMRVEIVVFGLLAVSWSPFMVSVFAGR